MNVTATLMHTEKKSKSCSPVFSTIDLGSVIQLFTKQILPTIPEEKFLFLENKMSNL